jgi:hypothetical protein
MSYQHVVEAEGWPFRQRAGGLVIHLPSVVRSSSPSCTFVIVVLLPTRFVRRFLECSMNDYATALHLL